MPGPFRSMSRIVQQLKSWRAARPESLPPSGVLVHDPAAARPHDLDDTFFDPLVQRRVATLIAGAARKKPDKKDEM